MIREEFLELLRTDPAFREEVRRQVLTDDLLALPDKFDRLTDRFDQLTDRFDQLTGRFDQLTDRFDQLTGRFDQLTDRFDQLARVVTEMAEAIRNLTEAQQRTEAALQQTQQELRRLAIWQEGEAGRRDGERFERETIRRAYALFDGGHGGAPDQPWVFQQLTERLNALPSKFALEAEEDPFLADLLWWKGEQIAVVEISLQLNEHDVVRAARRADTLRRAGAQAIAVVIGEDWATLDSKDQALARQVEWKVGSDLSEGFLHFRHAPSA